MTVLMVCVDNCWFVIVLTCWCGWCVSHVLKCWRQWWHALHPHTQKVSLTLGLYSVEFIRPNLPVQESQIDFFKDFIKFRLKHNNAMAFWSVPHSVQIVDALTPLVRKKRSRLGIRWFYPIWKQMSFVCFVPQILIQIGISDLFQGFNFIDRNKMTVQIHEFKANFFECSLC